LTITDIFFKKVKLNKYFNKQFKYSYNLLMIIDNTTEILKIVKKLIKNSKEFDIKTI